MVKVIRKRTGPGKQRAREFGGPIYGKQYVDPNGGGTLHWSRVCRRYLPVPTEDDENATTVVEPPQVIGVETVYLGGEACRGGTSARVKISAVRCRGRCLGAVPGQWDGGYGHVYVNDDLRLRQLGGVQPQDAIEVHFWLSDKAGWDKVACSVSPHDLAVFADLRPPKKAKKSPTTR